jgi:hypothetical protein
MIVALGLAGSVYSVPIQVSDSLETIRTGVASPTLATAFIASVRRSEDKFRPLGEVRSRLLVAGAETFGLSYHALFRGYHALAGAALVLLLVSALPARTWPDVAAVGFALAVLVGMHTFAGMFREAFPINHFLLISVYALATFVLASARGGFLIDAAAVLLLVTGLLTLESGVLLWVVALAARLGGRSGISRAGLLVMTAVLAAYPVARMLLDVAWPELGGNVSGWGTIKLGPEEQIARFGDAPLPFYAYNVATSVVTVLLSQPSAGQWTAVLAWMQDRLTPVYFVEIGSSLVTTALIVWYARTRTADGMRAWRTPAMLTFGLLLVANALMARSYVKNEIIGPAGAFYALAAGHALQALLSRPGRWPVHPLVAAVLIATSAAWAVRDMGLHFKLVHSAFRARAEWSLINRPGTASTEPDAHMKQLVARMKAEALGRRAAPPGQLPRWGERWWGAE